MDKISDAPAHSKTEETNHSPTAAKKNQQNVKDELPQFSRPDERSNVDILPELQSTLPENVDETASSIKRDSTEKVKCVHRLSVGETSVESTSVPEQKKSADILFEDQQNKVKCTDKIRSDLFQALSSNLKKMQQIAGETIEILYHIGSKSLAKEEEDEFLDLVSEKVITWTQDYNTISIMERSIRTNYACGSEDDPKSQIQTPLYEASEVFCTSATEMRKIITQSAIDFQKSIEEKYKTDTINSKKFSKSQSCVEASSTRRSDTLKLSKFEFNVPKSSLYELNTLEKFDFGSSETRFSGCESGTSDLSESRAKTEESLMSHLDTEESPGSSGDTEESPGSSGDTEESPGSSGDAEESPGSSGDAEESPGSSGDADESSGIRVMTDSDR